MSHTKGPWKIYDIDSSTPHIGTISTTSDAGWKYYTICLMYEDISDNYDTNNDYQTFNNYKANAKLIASAPALLEALESLAGMAANFPTELSKQHPDVINAYEIIKKVKGE